MTDKAKLSKLSRLLKTDRFVILDLALHYAHQSIEIEDLIRGKNNTNEDPNIAMEN